MNDFIFFEDLWNMNSDQTIENNNNNNYGTDQ
jgi:hypothetical protein